MVNVLKQLRNTKRVNEVLQKTALLIRQSLKDQKNFLLRKKKLF